MIFLHDYLLHLKEKEVNMNLIKTIEKGLLGVIALLTIVATVQEIASIYMVGRVNLPDLLLLFIYTEVLGMIGVFYVRTKYLSHYHCLLP